VDKRLIVLTDGDVKAVTVVCPCDVAYPVDHLPLLFEDTASDSWSDRQGFDRMIVNIGDA
jgi:hypothetical protein